MGMMVELVMVRVKGRDSEGEGEGEGARVCTGTRTNLFRPGARHGMNLYTSSADPAATARLSVRVMGSLLVGFMVVLQLLKLGRREFVPFPVQGHPIVQPWLNHRHD